MYDPLTTPTEPLAIIDMPGAPSRPKTTPTTADPGSLGRKTVAPMPQNQVS
jgi:hypothetical protein